MKRIKYYYNNKIAIKNDKVKIQINENTFTIDLAKIEKIVIHNLDSNNASTKEYELVKNVNLFEFKGNVVKAFAYSKDDDCYILLTDKKIKLGCVVDIAIKMQDKEIIINYQVTNKAARILLEVMNATRLTK